MKPRAFWVIVPAVVILALAANWLHAQTPKPPVPAKPVEKPSEVRTPITGVENPATTQPIPTRAPNGRNGNGMADVLADIMDHHTARVQVDGNVMGRVFTFDDAGNVVFVRVKLKFIQNQKIIYTADSNEWGRFQVPGMQPGTYSVIAHGPPGIGVAKMRVLAYEPASGNRVSRNAVAADGSVQLVSNLAGMQPTDFVMHVTTIPLPDAEQLSKTLAELPLGSTPPAPAPAAAQAPAGAGGGAGTGAAIAAGLGALGAGMGASFGGGGGGGGAVSQFVPTPTP